MNFIANFIYLDENGDELTSSIEYITAESEKEAKEKADDLCTHLDADEYTINESF